MHPSRRCSAHMTARVWTLEELDRVHPLPEGWAWRLWDGEPMACSGELEIFADGDEVWGQGRGANMTALPSAVCIAVILASQGLDSREAIADALAGFAGVSLQCEGDSPAGSEDAAPFGAQASAYTVGAAMVRRGTVAP
jgi:hypothetical protein